jgi:hypothetical protein
MRDDGVMKYRGRTGSAPQAALLLLLVASGASLAGCRARESEKPEAPDMSELLQAYDEPTGRYTDETAPQIHAALCDKFGITGALCDWDDFADMVCEQGWSATDCSPCDSLQPVFKALESVGIGFEAGSSPTDAGPDADAGEAKIPEKLFSGEGWARLTRICGGTGGEAVADESNGTVELTIGFTDQGLDRVVWGDFHQCEMRIGDSAVDLDGQIRLDLGDTIGLDGKGDFRPTIEIVGTVKHDGKKQQVAVDLQLGFEDGPSISMLLALPDDERVVFFIDRNGPGFRLSDGVKELSPEGLVCDASDAGQP